MKKNLRRLCLVTGLIAAALQLYAQEFPGQKWNTLEKPEQVGWSKEKLDGLRKYLIDSTQVTGFLIVERGKIVFEFGDVTENSYIASCRKSILSMLYGRYVRSGEIRLDKTLAELGVDDLGGLPPAEKKATVRDIISARSGIFHLASYYGDYLEYAPKRGSVQPGTYWLYSNWDFNMAGYIFEKETRRDIYEEIEKVLAVPLQMQDWNRSLQHKDGDSTRSRYLAYPVWLSTRDMARIGLLMLNNGRWNGNQLIDPDWINEMLTPRTSYQEVNGHTPAKFRVPGYDFAYGYMWWLWRNVKDKRFNGAYSALGNIGQSISVFSACGVVVAYKTKDIYERETPLSARFRILTLAVEAKVPE